ncbi:Phosphatidylinositol 4-phosphate 5-kinase 7 [Glycine max]|nr:Phosphatidylinositol 4-phosphate 5-kinase 7 [Glycine max]
MMSICGDSGLTNISSPRKSGNIFFLSQDDRFENELPKSISSCSVKANVIKSRINFIEDTWVLQRDELERHGDYFVNLAIQLLTTYQKELEPCINHIRTFFVNLENLSQRLEMTPSADTDESEVLSLRRNLKEEYLTYEAKIITTFSVVDNMKKQFYAQHRKISSCHCTILSPFEERVKELFDAIEKLRTQFKSIERPILEIEIPAKVETPPLEKKFDATLSVYVPPQGVAAQGIELSKPETNEQPKSPSILDDEAKLAKLEYEFGKVSKDYSAEEIGDWEFDELLLLPMAYPFSDFKYSSDGLTIVGISFCTTIVCEAISWVFIYRTNSYKILH